MTPPDFVEFKKPRPDRVNAASGGGVKGKGRNKYFAFLRAGEIIWPLFEWS